MVSGFLHIIRTQRRCPLLRASFSLRPAATKETKFGCIASEDRDAQEARADKIERFTSSFPINETVIS